MLFRQANWSGPQPCAGSWMAAYVCLLVCGDHQVAVGLHDQLRAAVPAVLLAQSGMVPGA